MRDYGRYVEPDLIVEPDAARPVDPQAGTAGLRARVLTGVAWKAASQILIQVTRFSVSIVLARLLAPEQWGLAAMVVVLSGAIVLFSDSALGTVLIQRRSITDNDRSTVFWAGVGIGAALTCFGIAVAGPVSRFYGEPKVQPLFAVLSVSFLVTSLGTTQGALLLRDMEYRRLELRRMASTIVGAATGITIALQGGGAWAIVGQLLGASVVDAVLAWYFIAWRPKLVFSRETIRNIGGFTGNVFGQNLLYYVGRNADNVLIGRYLGAASLGTYGLAYSVMLAPFNQITSPLQQLLFPAFSRLQDDRERLADVWIRVTRLVAAISMPALIGLIVVAPDFVSTFLGADWHGAARIIQILAWVGLIQSLQHLNGEILYALDQSRTFLWFTVLWATASVAAFVIGLQWGLVGVAACYAISSTLVEPVNAWCTARALGISVWRFLGGMAGVAQATAIMGLAVLGTRMALVSAGVPAPLRLAIVVAVGFVVFAASCWWRAPDVVDEVRNALRRRRAATPVSPNA